MSTILSVCGSTRAGSTNAAVLATAAAVAPAGITVVPGVAVAELPHFNPDHDVDPLPPAVAELRAAIGAADAVLFCTPEYAGTLPGALKNLLDWSIGGPELAGRRCGWVNVASVAAPTGGAGAHDTLRTVLGYAGAHLVEAACLRRPLTREQVGPDGLITDPAVHDELRAALRALITPD